MNRQIVIASVAGAVLLVGAASAAVAAETAGGSGTSGTGSTTSGTATTTSAHKAGKARHHEAFRGEYAQWTTWDAKTSADVVHDGIRGTVTAVSPTSITVKAKDGTSETFTVSSSTGVHLKGAAKGAKGSIGEVKTGDRVEVVGTGKTAYAATHVRDDGAPKPAASTPSS